MVRGESPHGLRRYDEDEPPANCSATMDSVAVPGHTHSCVGRHDAGDHYCADCGRWWWHA